MLLLQRGELQVLGKMRLTLLVPHGISLLLLESFNSPFSLQDPDLGLVMSVMKTWGCL